jgi:uncharacterized membrane protein
MGAGSRAGTRGVPLAVPAGMTSFTAPTPPSAAHGAPAHDQPNSVVHARTAATPASNVDIGPLSGAVEGQTWIDPIAERVQPPVHRLLGSGCWRRSLLSGTWLGHPVHSAVTDLPVGAWTAGFILDMAHAAGLGRDLDHASDAVQTVGLVGAMGAAIFGLADWSHTAEKPRRVGMLHGMINMGVAVLYGVSLRARATGNRGFGVALSAVGFALLMFSAWLGGELSYRYGVGVNREAFGQDPERRRAQGGAPDAMEGWATGADASRAA